MQSPSVSSENAIDVLCIFCKYPRTCTHMEFASSLLEAEMCRIVKELKSSCWGSKKMLLKGQKEAATCW